MRERCPSFRAGRKESRGWEGRSVAVTAGGRLMLPPLPHTLHTTAIPRVLPGLSHLGTSRGLSPLPQRSAEKLAHTWPLKTPLKTSLHPGGRQPAQPRGVSTAPGSVLHTPALSPTPRGRKHDSTQHRCGRTLCPGTWNATGTVSRRTRCACRRLPPTRQDRAQRGGQSRAWSLPSGL